MSIRSLSIETLVHNAIQAGASDIHITPDFLPMMRVDGKISPMFFSENLVTHIHTETLLAPIMNEETKKCLNTHWETDFSYAFPDSIRIRANVFRQSRGIGAVLRIIPSTITHLETLHMPKIIQDIALLPKGLVLVTGPTGSGKSTTLASMLDYINRQTQKHIITIEDPIEFIHSNQRSLIRQREVHRDTHSFQNALRAALREDPDVILVGELRDLETIRLAITAAETGHLVLATLHTSSAEKTIHRIVDVFPGEEKNTVRSILSESLEAVIAQTLVPKKNGGRIAAVEIMIATPAIRHLIREDKTAQMVSAIQTGQTVGMQTMGQHLMWLKENELVC